MTQDFNRLTKLSNKKPCNLTQAENALDLWNKIQGKTKKLQTFDFLSYSISKNHFDDDGSNHLIFKKVLQIF